MGASPHFVWRLTRGHPRLFICLAIAASRWRSVTLATSRNSCLSESLQRLRVDGSACRVAAEASGQFVTIGVLSQLDRELSNSAIMISIPMRSRARRVAPNDGSCVLRHSP